MTRNDKEHEVSKLCTWKQLFVLQTQLFRFYLAPNSRSTKIVHLVNFLYIIMNTAYRRRWSKIKFPQERLYKVFPRSLYTHSPNPFPTVILFDTYQFRVCKSSFLISEGILSKIIPTDWNKNSSQRDTLSIGHLRKFKYTSMMLWIII